MDCLILNFNNYFTKKVELKKGDCLKMKIMLSFQPKGEILIYSLND